MARKERLDTLLEALRSGMSNVNTWVDGHDTIGDAKRLSEEYLPTFVDEYVKSTLTKIDRLIDALSDPDVPELSPDVMVPVEPRE